jgi:plasmid stabilization system protein ParE
LRLVVRSIAEAELAEAHGWYLSRSPDAARRFIEAVDEALDEIARRTDSFPRVHGRLQRALVRGFPYALYFAVHRDTINVVGLVHAKRHPGRWQDRD